MFDFTSIHLYLRRSVFSTFWMPYVGLMGNILLKVRRNICAITKCDPTIIEKIGFKRLCAFMGN